MLKDLGVGTNHSLLIHINPKWLCGLGVEFYISLVVCVTQSCLNGARERQLVVLEPAWALDLAVQAAVLALNV